MDKQQARILPRAVVVVPTYDERENIALMIDEILAQQSRIPDYDLHALVSDSHSKDGTLELVRQIADENPKAHLLDVMERGIGIGLRKGFEYAIHELDAAVLVEMDADFQHNPRDIPELLRGIADGYDLVVGSRFLPGSENKMPFYRRILSVGANGVLRLMLGLKHVTEITTSYRAFTRDIFLKLDQDAVPWHADSFVAVPVFLVRMIEAGAAAKEIPMTMHPRVRGYSKMQYGRYIRDIFLFSIASRVKRLTQ